MRPSILMATAAIVSVALMFAFGLVSPERIALLTGADPPIPAAAAEFELVALDGSPVSADTLRGSIIVLEFWATWCGPCLSEIDDYNELVADYADRGVRVVGLAMESGDAATVERFSREYGIEYEVAMGDRQTWESFGPAWGFPQTVLIDHRWRLRGAWIGAGGTKMRDLRAAIDDILTEARDVPSVH